MKFLSFSKTVSETQFLSRRYRQGQLWRALFLLATLIGIVALATLLVTVINQSIGYVAIDNSVEPSTLSDKPLKDLDQAELIALIEKNLSKARVRQLNAEKLLTDQSTEELYSLVMERIVDPVIVANWFLFKLNLNKARN